MKKILRDYLAESALFLEAVEQTPQVGMVQPYYGINVSKTSNEPIDQLTGLIFAKRIQEWNLQNFNNTGQCVIFIGGLFEILNSQDLEQLNEVVITNLQKELEKKNVYQLLTTTLGIRVKILTTLDLWQDQAYWEILKSLIDKQVFTRGLLINDTMQFYETKDQLMNTVRVKEIPSKYVNLPLSFIKKIGNWPAPLLYTPAEVAEALYLKQKYGVNAKIGQAQERVYDKYLIEQMSVFRFRQSTDLTSTQQKPQTVTPYIDKEKNKDSLRIFFSDLQASVKKKISQAVRNEYTFTVDESFGEILNPIVEKCVLAVEAARCRTTQSVTIENTVYSTGKQVVDAVLSDQLTVTEISQILPSLVEAYINSPMRKKS